MQTNANPTFEKLRRLHLQGFIIGLEEQMCSSSYNELSFNDRLSLLVEREFLERENRTLQRRLKNAHLKKQQASIENINVSSSRGLGKTILNELSSCNWIKQKRPIIITGPSGVGKSFLAEALAHKSCLLNYSALYIRATELLDNLEAAKIAKNYRKLLLKYSKIDLLIIDDFALCSFTEDEEKHLFELIEERTAHSSTIFTGQTPINEWHSLMPNPTIADAILDRIVHTAIKIKLTGESKRKISKENLDEVNPQKA